MKHNFAMLFFLILTQLSMAQNPITEYKGLSDPHIRVFNDTIYLYSGHDDSPTDKLWVMKDWRVFSSTNLLNWKLETTISPKENYMEDDSPDCWASDAATKNGKYYFYFSDQKRGVGVMTSDSPSGPFKDALGKHLVSPMHDPTAFIDNDNDQTPYLLYGDKHGGGFRIARLNSDMISLYEEPKEVIITGKEWDDAPKWMDKSYLFKEKDTYYLSWGRDYAISKNVYGPYESVGAVGKGHNLDQLAHGSFFYWKGQFYHVWCYYIKKGFKYRESIISYCHMDDNGKIVTDVDFLNKHFKTGVGQYDASWPKIEAEWFYEKTNEIEKKGTRKDGFKLKNIEDGSWIRFDNVNFGEEYKKFSAELFFSGEKGTIEVRTDSPKGELLGKTDLSSLIGTYQKISFDIKPIKGKKNIYLVFHAKKGATIELDWFKFDK